MLLILSVKLICALLYSFRDRVDAVHAALCDSINTPAVLDEIMALTTYTNKYLVKGASYVNIDVLEDITSWISGMMETFGIEMGANAKSSSDADVSFFLIYRVIHSICCQKQIELILNNFYVYYSKNS